MFDSFEMEMALAYLEQIARKDFGRHFSLDAWASYAAQQAGPIQHQIDGLVEFAALADGTYVAKCCLFQAGVYQQRLDAVAKVFGFERGVNGNA